MEGDGLVVSDVSPASAFAGEELGIEAPGDDGVDDKVVGAVDIEFLRDSEELALAAGAGSASDELGFIFLEYFKDLPVQSGFLRRVQTEETRVGDGDYELHLDVFDV